MTDETEVAETETKENKGVVPAKYAGKYKGTHEERGDKVGMFFRSQVNGDDGKIDLDKWVQFMVANGIAEDDAFITKRVAWVNDKVGGAAGRLAMDGRNKCISLARAQDGKLKGLNGRWSDDLELPEKKTPPRKAKAEEGEEAA